jgi:hypothetical protein
MYMSSNNETYAGLRLKCPLLLPDFNQSWSFSADFLKRPQYQIQRKSVQWKPRWYMRADEQTYMTKLTGPFREYVNAPKMQKQILNWGIYRTTKFGFGVCKCNINEFLKMR